jgi:hypothetical protein
MYLRKGKMLFYAKKYGPALEFYQKFKYDELCMPNNNEN